MRKILDLSEHNTINNYNGFADVDGVILKASEGVTYKDSSFENKYINLKDKVKLGAYHMLCVTSNPIDQAVEFWNCIKDKELQILPCLDIEYTNLAEHAEEYATAFINKFKELSGLDVIIYTCYYYYKDNFSRAFKDEHYWWIASYGTSIKPSVDKLVMWQYTEECDDYSFISGLIDCSYLYDDYIFINGASIIGDNKEYIEKYSKYDYIKTLQHECNVQGFRDKYNNTLVEDGIFGELTLSALPTLKEGATGNITAVMQKLIGVQSDGIFGNITYSGVIDYQFKNNLQSDGIVGRNTWRCLLNE